MYKMILKSALILSLPALSAYAQMGPNKEYLANQCFQLSQIVTSLVSSQQKSTCIEKLNLASSQMNNAAEFILGDATTPAKLKLDDAIFTLQYAELNSCNRYIEISHSKFAAQKIRNLL